MITTYNAASIDGFIAHKDGSEEFIPDEVFDDFLDILRKHDALVMGRKTYETIQNYPKAMVETFEAVNIKRFVVSQNASFQVKNGYTVITEITEIPKLGNNVLISSGPTLNSAALRAGIIDHVMINVIPGNINEGIPVFDEMPKFALVSTEEKPAGRKLCTYDILP